MSEDISHILTVCPSLKPTRDKLREFTADFSLKQPEYLQELIMMKCSEKNQFLCQFLLDCSVDADVIRLTQEYNADVLRPIFQVTRTWVYMLHKQRLKLLGLWRPAGN